MAYTSIYAYAWDAPWRGTVASRWRIWRTSSLALINSTCSCQAFATARRVCWFFLSDYHVINLYPTDSHGLLQFVLINTSEHSLSLSLTFFLCVLNCKKSALQNSYVFLWHCQTRGISGIHGDTKLQCWSLGSLLHALDLSLRPSVPPTWPPSSLLASTSMRQDYQSFFLARVSRGRFNSGDNNCKFGQLQST